ncbi:MAG: peptidase S41, partial [Flavobacteriales bacterium CG03_land_8_20_14_0_80_35_15]
QEMSLGDGSSVRLTTARYYTPTGRSIQKPYNHNGNLNYFNELEKRFNGGELTNADSIKVVDSLKYKTPKGKTVYGGGGIVPDIFVPIDTANYINSFHFTFINNFVFNYIDEHRKEFKNQVFENFNANFDADESIFKAYLKEIKYTKRLDAKLKTQIKFYLKALFTRELFDDNKFYKFYNQNDNMIQKVLEIDKK